MTVLLYDTQGILPHGPLIPHMTPVEAHEGNSAILWFLSLLLILQCRKPMFLSLPVLQWQEKMQQKMKLSLFKAGTRPKESCQSWPLMMNIVPGSAWRLRTNCWPQVQFILGLVRDQMGETVYFPVALRSFHGKRSFLENEDYVAKICSHSKDDF